MKYQVRMTFARPEQLREALDENGKRVVERIPQHPTRPARPFEVNCWWEDAPGELGPFLAQFGATVRTA